MVVLIKAEGVSKKFPSVQALLNVQFMLKAGEIHALLGENGAGKSTLIKVLTGVEKHDSGKIFFENKEIYLKNTQEAQNIGISTVYQEVNLCTNLSVAENIYIGREFRKNGFIDWKIMYEKAKILLKDFNLDIDVTKPLHNYSVAIQQMVAIARAVDISAKVLILDEPTSSLSSPEVKNLFKIMNMLKSRGLGIIFVTHFLDQVYEVCDTITVLRNGEYVGTYVAKKLQKIELIAKMVGKEYSDFDIKPDLFGESMSENDTVVLAEHCSSSSIRDISFKIQKGSVTGLSGLLGSGRSEIARLIFGIDSMTSGTLHINNHRVKIKKPLDSIRHNIAFCPENRNIEGVIDDLTIRENIMLALQTKKGLFNLISRKESEVLADKYIEQLQIKTPSREQLVKNLSGGNKQKVILGRWLATHPELFILDEPTRGIDIRTKGEIQRIVIDLAHKGMAILFISSEIDEMLRCCNRMVILRDKKQIGNLVGNQISETAILKYIAGETDADA